MSTPNNITKNWESVLRTAETELAATVQEANRLAQNSVAPLFDRKSILEQQVAAAKAQIAAATANNQNTTALQSTLARLESELSTVTRDYNTFNSTLLQLENKVRSLRTQINEAKSQIATQAAKTTPATNTTVAATVNPASAKPGNPNIATTPTPAPTTKTRAPTSFDGPTPAPTPTPTPVRAPAPVAVTSEPPLPPIRVEPVTVDIPTFDSRGRQTGTQQVTIESPPIPAEVGLQDPGSLATPIIDQAELDALSAEIAASLPTAEELIANVNPFEARADWRVRLALSDAFNVNYLYNAPNPGILKPLQATSGVIFPYTPTISVNYSANYNPTDLVHSNYKVYQYSNSSIDSITIQSDFTAQDEYEANYLLAVIHFFRSATKMFYGQDQNPRRGTPPPLCYIYGMGSYQFAGQPLAISQFSYNLPNNVDYIKTSTGGSQPAPATSQPPRLAGTGAAPGGTLPPPQFSPIAEPGTVTWVPSKIQLSITCVPMMSRNAVSNEFSLEKYATGSLLNGVDTFRGGFW